jgi:hypothetical protein
VAGKVNDADAVKPVEHELASAASRNPNIFSVTSILLASIRWLM